MKLEQERARLDKIFTRTPGVYSGFLGLQNIVRNMIKQNQITPKQQNDRFRPLADQLALYTIQKLRVIRARADLEKALEETEKAQSRD